MENGAVCWRFELKVDFRDRRKYVHVGFAKTPVFEIPKVYLQLKSQVALASKQPAL
jgi:hypothetical protein